MLTLMLVTQRLHEFHIEVNEPMAYNDTNAMLVDSPMTTSPNTTPAASRQNTETVPRKPVRKATFEERQKIQDGVLHLLKNGEKGNSSSKYTN